MSSCQRSAILILGFSFCLLSFTFCLASQPRIEFDEITFDFGSMYQNDEVVHQFRFRNTGDATLKIENVKTTCGCTAALPGVRELAPGAESTIQVTFRSGNYRDRVTKHVDVDSNDPMQPRVTLTIKGDIKVEVDVKPNGIYFGSTIAVGQKTERSVELTAVDVKSFNIIDITSDNPLVRVGKPEPFTERRPDSLIGSPRAESRGRVSGYRLNVTVGPLDAPGRVNANVKIRTDLPHTKQIVIHVYGRIVAQDASKPARPQ